MLYNQIPRGRPCDSEVGRIRGVLLVGPINVPCRGTCLRRTP